MISPPLTLPGDSYMVKFWMHRDGGYLTNHDSVSVYYNTAPNLTGATCIGTAYRSISLPPATADTGWHEYKMYLPLGSAGSSRYVIFLGASKFGNNMFLDDVTIDVPPPCIEPGTLAAGSIGSISANLTWLPGGTEAEWEYSYGPVPMDPPAGAGDYTTTDNLNNGIGSLSPNTNYIFYVRSKCGPDVFSGWVSGTFKTLCGSVGYPYYQNFDAVTAPTIPDCMKVTDDNADNVKWLNYTSTTSGMIRSTPNAMRIGYNSSADMDDWFFTPAITLAPGTYKVSFWYRGSGTYPEKLEVKWGTKAEAAFMTNGPIFDNNNITNTVYTEGVGYIVVGPSAGGDYYVGWHGYSDMDMFYLLVDDISITEALAHDVGTVSIDNIGGFVPNTPPITPTVTVKNFGANDETIDVTINITDTYTSTKTGVFIASGASIPVTFDDVWTPTIGTWTVQVYTTLSTDMEPLNDTITQAITVKVPVKIYGYVAYAATSGLVEGPCYFYDTDPGTITQLGPTTTAEFICAGTWANGVWYGSEYYDAVYNFDGGGWWTINPTDGTMTNLAPGGSWGRSFTGITYDHTNNIMYGVDYDDVNLVNNLYTIALSDGAATLVGTLTDVGENLLINLATDGNGHLFSYDLDTDHLWEIDPALVSATDVGYSGLDFQYAQDMEYDYVSSTMFVAAETPSVGQLMTANLTTGAASLIAQFQGTAEICGLAIPYGSIPTTKTLHLTDVFMEGLYAGSNTMNQALDIDLETGNPVAKWADGVADTITVELHDSTAYAYHGYETIIYKAISIPLLTDGTATVTIPSEFNSAYYVTIKQRNHLETTTALPVVFTGLDDIDYAFDAQDKAYGNNMGLMIDLVPVIFAGDENQDGAIEGFDLAEIGNAVDAFGFGYIKEDIDSNAGMDGYDLAPTGNNSDAFIAVILP